MKLDKIFHTQSFGKCSSIMESIKFLDKNASNVRIIRGENDLIKYLENNTDNRVVYDIANRWYLVGDIEKYIHDYLLDYACDAGLYYAKNGRDYKINNANSLVCFVTHCDENESFRFAEDSYTTQYNYSWINVFDRNGEFKKIPLYKALGKPIYEIDISEEDDDEYLNESVSFELTDDEFVLGGKEFHEEGEDIQVFNIYNDTVKIGMLAITEYADNSISLDGLKILPKFRKQGFGKQVVDILKKKYKSIYVRSIPSAKKFWQKQGHDAYYNNDSGTYDGDLIYEESEFISEAVNEYSLYHGCDLAYAVSMIIENRMRGETVANINGKEVQGNSMTRNYNFAKQWQEERWSGSSDVLNQFWVVLELDYNRLKHNHKIVPYNYWEDYFGSEYEHTVDRNGYGNQYEEFVIGPIGNLQLYIKDVYLSDECFYTDYDEILDVVKDELNLRGERYSDKQIRIALNQLGIQNGYIDREELDESIAYVSKKDLSDIILMNPTKRELRENNLTLCRCMEDSEGNWYFADMENMLHAYIVSELRDEAYFPLFDGNDCYGIAYYDAESNEFWYNLNDYMYKKECIEQYNNSEYLRTTFPNARIIPNPWSDQGYDELYESVKYLNKEHCDTKIITSPSEMRDYIKNHKNIRIVYDALNQWYFVNDSMKAIHSQILDDAISAGYYNEYEVNSGNDILYSPYYEQFPLFVVSDNYNENWSGDGYENAYRYDSFVVYDRYGEFKETTLYQVLGNPLEKISMVGDELYEAVTPEQVPEKLYHATFSKLLRKIKKCGYLGNSPYKLWSDSNNKYVYLATDPDEAYSYAETALDDCDNERLYDMLEDDDIVILEIDTKYLDKNKLFRDENVVDGETTYQYEGIINCQIMKIYKPSLNEEIVYSKTYNDGYNNGLIDVILKNPTRKELYDNHMDAARVVIDTSTGDFYFCGAGDFIHDQMIDKIGVGSNDSIFYDYHENTFYIRDEWEDEEDLEYFYNENKGWLSAYPYIQNNMPNFKLKMMDIYGPETPWD